MDPIGRSPLPVPVLLLGKLSMLCCWLFFFGRAADIEMIYDEEWSRIAGIVLTAIGAVVVVFAFRDLGESVSVGLSREDTQLKTAGIYAVTRNPMYLGGFAISLGSCFYSVHPVNFLFLLITAVIHHAIVLREEVFLGERFGTRWMEYANRVPRYFAGTMSARGDLPPGR